MLINCFY